MESGSPEEAILVSVFGKTDIISAGISFLNVVLIAIIIFISFRNEKRDLCTVYTINLFITFIPLEVLRLYHQVHALYFPPILKNVVVFTKTDSHIRLTWFTGMFVYCRWLVDLEYRILGIFLVSLVLLLFKKPFLYQTVNHRKHMWFAVGHIVAALQAFVSATINFISEDSKNLYSVGKVIYWETAPLKLITYATMLIVSAWSLVTVLLHKSEIASRIVVSHKAIHRRQLISVLIYCTPPNLINFSSSLPRSFCFAYVSFNGEFGKMEAFCGAVSQIDETLMQYRLIVLAISTMIAFREYRRSVLKLLGIYTHPVVQMNTFQENLTMNSQMRAFHPVDKRLLCILQEIK